MEDGELDADYGGKNGLFSWPCFLKMLGRKEKLKKVYASIYANR